jgi:hypothetical protein
MFEQPPLTEREVFGRGFVQGLFGVFISFLLAIGLAARSEFRFGVKGFISARSEIVVEWLVLCTLVCAMSFSPRDEERLATFRAGLITAYVLFLFLDATCWLVKI